MDNQTSRKSQLRNTVPVDKFFCILNHQPVVFYNTSMLKRTIQEGTIKIMYTMCEKIAPLINEKFQANHKSCLEKINSHKINKSILSQSVNQYWY